MAISIGSILASVGADLSPLEAALQNAHRKMLDTGERLRVVGDFMTRTITDAFVGIGQRAVGMAGQMEQARMAFGSILGSAEAADAFIRQLYDFAEKTPFEYTGLQAAAQRLMAFGFNAQEVIPILTTVGDTLSAFGGISQESLGRAIRALGQMRASGTILKEDLNQLIDLGIPVFDILKEKLGLSAQQVANIGKEGISSATVIDALLNGMSERFGGTMQVQSRTLLGLWSNFVDAGTRFLADFGQVIVDTFDLKTKLATAVQWLQDFVGWFKNLDPDIRKTILTVGVFVSALGPLLTTVGLLTPAIRGLGLVFGTVFGPAGLVVLAVATAVTAVLTHWDEIKSAATRTVDWLNSEWGRFKAEHETVGRVVDAVNSTIERSIRDKIVASGGKLREFAGAAAYMSRDTRASVDKLEQRLGFFRTGAEKAFQGASATISDWQRSAGIKIAVVKKDVESAATKTKAELDKFGGAFGDGRRRAKQELDRLESDIEDHLRAVKDLYLTEGSVLSGMAGDAARAIYEQYRSNLKLDLATQEQLGLVSSAVRAYREQMMANGRLLVQAITEGVQAETDGLTDAANKAGEAAMDGVKDGLERKSSGAFATWKGFVDDIKENFKDLGITTHDVAAQIAEDFWDGEFSVKKVFDDLAHALYSSVMTTIIETILKALVDKIIEIYNAMRGGAGPHGAGGGLMKPGGPGDGGDGGGDGGGVGIPVPKGLAPSLDKFTRTSGDRAVGMAMSALSQGLSKMILNFGEYGSQAAKDYLADLFGPEGALRNVPGFNEIDFPSIWDVFQYFFSNWGDWLPGGGGWGPGDGFPGGGWKPGMGAGLGALAGGSGVTVIVNGSLMSVRDAAREVESEFARLKGANGRLAFER